MRKYFFQAVTEEGKQISGFVSAPNKDEAHDKLRASHLSILTLEEPKGDELEVHKGISFEFSGINAQHKKIRGTIESENRYSAYKKLVLDYKIDLDYVVETALAPPQKSAEKAKGISKEMKIRLDIERKKREKEDEKKHKKVDTGKQLDIAVEENESERQFMMEKIDEMLMDVIPLLEENAEYIDSHKKREIEERINLLLRLKNSNAVSHLKSLTKRLLEQIGDDGLFISENIPPELEEELARRKARFKSMGGKFNKVISKGLMDIQVKLLQVDTKAIKENIIDIKIITQVVNIFYLSFVWVFLFTTLFLLWTFFQESLGFAEYKTEYFIYSPLMWYVWGFCGIMFLFFGVFRFTDLIQTWKEKLQLLGAIILALIVYTIQFPVIFYWVI